MLGWWGFPFGVIFTPVQIVRNVIGLCRSPDPMQPSGQLENMIKLDLGTQMVLASEQPNAEQSRTM
jgi:hypothetical protein